MIITRIHTPMATSMFVFVVCAFLVVGISATHSCPLGSDAAMPDSIAPAPPAAAVHAIKRGEAQDGDLGQIKLFVSGSDNATPARSLRYRLRLIGGNLPQGLQIPENVVSSDRARVDGRRIDLVTLEWCDGGSDIQDPFDFSLVVFAIDQAGNVSPPSDTVRVTHSGHYVDIIFSSRIGGTNLLDTSRGVFIKDMVVGDPIELNITLTADQRNKVLAKAHEVGFFQLPGIIIPDSTSCVLTPCTRFYLNIRAGRVSHHVSWDNCNCWEMESLRELRVTLWKMIEETDEYKRSPRPRGAYM